MKKTLSFALFACLLMTLFMGTSVVAAQSDACAGLPNHDAVMRESES